MFDSLLINTFPLRSSFPEVTKVRPGEAPSSSQEEVREHRFLPALGSSLLLEAVTAEGIRRAGRRAREGPQHSLEAAICEPAETVDQLCQRTLEEQQGSVTAAP